jgi:hypothetical protein
MTPWCQETGGSARLNSGEDLGLRPRVRLLICLAYFGSAED